MATMNSYDLKGKKLSFANWISNLSPIDTPFVSMTGKESVDQTKFYWQTDRLDAPAENAVVEGSDALIPAAHAVPTIVQDNVTQILRKVIKVSDTANSLANYGRGRELQYQMEKAGKALKRDLESILLSGQGKAEGGAAGAGGTGTARKTAGFFNLVAPLNAKDVDTKAVVNKATVTSSNTFTEAEIFDLTYNLYLAGSKANIIMFHPRHAGIFANLMEDVHGTPTADRMKIFDGADTKFVHYVNSLVDPLGQEFKLIPNRFMPQDCLYFYNASDWTQMVLRAPTRTELAKDGSAETWMMEMEVGLRHRDPFASGILKLKS